MFENFITYVVNQATVIVKAWLVFGLAQITIAWAMWKFLGWVKAEQFASLQSKLDLKQAEADDYKRKLDGATPDEAKQRIDALEAKVVELSTPGPNAILQRSLEVGAVTGPVIDLPNRSVSFTCIFADGQFDASSPFEFRGLRLRITRQQEHSKGETLGVETQMVVAPVCEILKVGVQVAVSGAAEIRLGSRLASG